MNTSNGNRTAAPIEGSFKIEFRVSIVSEDEKHEVPLGAREGDAWHPYHFIEGGPEGSLALDRHDLAEWLSGPNSFGSEFLPKDEAIDAIDETIQEFRRVVGLSKENDNV